MRGRLKILLPLVIGVVSVPLMIWDIHNQKVIGLVGMGWDTGAPLWPYQTPDTILGFINAPASIPTNIISNHFGIFSPWRNSYFLFFILAWWWLAGLYFDRPSSRRDLPKTPTKAVLVGLLAICLISLGVEELSWPLRWWWTYSRSILTVTDLILLRLLTPSLWCFALGSVSAFAAWRRMRGDTKLPADKS